MHIQKREFRNVEACVWRSKDQTGVPVCGLLRDVTGLPESSCRVSDPACIACCESAQPRTDRFNPIVASLVYAAAHSVLEQGGHPDCSVGKARQLQSMAETQLEHVSGYATDSVIPARQVMPCIYQGAALPDLSDGTQQYHCRHPQHETANALVCSRCRQWSREVVPQQLTLTDLLPPPSARCAPVVRKWAVGVTTAPRQQQTLAACLDSLFRAGWEDPHLFVDGGAVVPARFHHLAATWRDRQLGAWSNYAMALVELGLQHPDADAYLLVQDDAWFFDRENLRQHLENVLWPGDSPGIVSLYCSEADTPTTDGWHRHSRPWVWGALAFIFPRSVLERFIRAPLLFSRPAADVNGPLANVDSATGAWAHAQKIPFWFPSPSLVQHIGNTSSLWTNSDNAGPRRADWFAADLDTAFHASSELGDFPEEEFPPSSRWQPSFEEAVSRGKSRMADARVVICGLCRDVRLCLPRTAARIERLGTMFADYRVVLYENDSSDGTQQFLHWWATQNSAVQILSEEFGHERFPQIRSLKRATRLAAYRNKYLEHVRLKFADFDFAIVVDTDLRGGWSYDGIAHTFARNDWDFTGSYGVLKQCRTRPNRRELLHFDAWAFRSAGDSVPLGSAALNRIDVERGAPAIPVWSCFGGLGVYRMDCFTAASYDGADCEHVVFHRAMRESGFCRQFLNPAQLTVY